MIPWGRGVVPDPYPPELGRCTVERGERKIRGTTDQRRGTAAPARPEQAKSPGLVVEVQEVPCLCMVDGGWIRGSICLPPARSLTDYLNVGESFLKLRDVRTPQGATFPFLGVRTDRVMVVVPEARDVRVTNDNQVGQFASRRVTFLMPDGEIEGTLEILAAIRVSDHLNRALHFSAIRDCSLRLPMNPGEPSFPDPTPIVVVNMHRVVAAAETVRSRP